MALDGAFLYAVKSETEFLKGSRVEKVYQPSRDEIIIGLRTRQGAYRLLISANANNSRVHITKISVDNPKTPPMFCMLLRKHIGGGKLIDIRQDGLERILYLDFECVNELGDVVTITLACEIMGRCSNLVVINQEGKIIDSIKRVDPEMSRERIILPNTCYQLPPREERLNFLEADKITIANRIKSTEPAELSKALIKVFEGISPILAREWAYYTSKGEYLKSSDITPEHINRLMLKIEKCRDMLLNGKCCFTVVKDNDGILKDFSFINIQQYGNLMQTCEYNSASELLDAFYAQRDLAVRMKQRANDLFKLLVNLNERISRRIAVQSEELEQCGNRDIYKLYGDLLSAEIYKIHKGDTVLVTNNFYDENYPEIEIKLDAMKTPSQNIQHYYNEYKKSATAEKKLAEQIEKGKEELQYIDSVFDALTRATTENEITQLRLELSEQGYIKSSFRKGKPEKSLPPVEYKSSDGFTILVGRNNIQNDKLSLKLAEKSDIWLHTQLITGSHVLILTDGETPPDKTVEEACIIASVNSRGKDSNLVPVDYCLAKYVKKPSGAKPGKVIFTNYKTAFVKPDSELAERLRVK